MNGAGLLLALIAGGFTGAIAGAYIARAVTLRVIADARAAYQAAAAADAQYHPPPTTSNGRTPMPDGAPPSKPREPFVLSVTLHGTRGHAKRTGTIAHNGLERHEAASLLRSLADQLENPDEY